MKINRFILEAALLTDVNMHTWTCVFLGRKTPVLRLYQRDQTRRKAEVHAKK